MEVANILADLELDCTAIVAGILHDIVEDTSYTIEQIRENFGDEVANLVDGVTKLARFPTGSVALAIRRLPFDVPSSEELGLPRIVTDLAKKKRAWSSLQVLQGLGSQLP